ncbi:Glutaredoxin [Carpediemonas membranifera]|uniref:Glutaredoxin n=1 Tax=Carpediemonas membranifera TaxID=201153 RepID=A0A8J6E592_9EUKA|nr:Glutaredoxin [Carpediemonas membranifera]|eukprot:KAG9395452.1 Glutaredoxin [Carpediemonas membranifera]
MVNVQELINSDDVVVFSKSYCPFCVRAKTELAKYTKFTAYELETRDDGSEIQTKISQISGIRTVPQIFIKGTPIGGCDDLLNLSRSGKLKNMLPK